MRLFSILRENHFCSSAFNCGSKKGSALLIVLGFLSFMVISGVSFAIYMRIERQAASNYRHSVTSRHLLNAALARAMDEIDSELRIRNEANVRWYEGGGSDAKIQTASSIPVQVKFPKWKDWPGRVKVSAVPDKEDNGEDARVLSLEALSFLPGVLLNDVRRFAKRHEGGNSADKGNSADEPYMGAKWRPLGNSVNEGVLGRYAYVCVNVSDMLNVNQCLANWPRDSLTNHVSLGVLFDNSQDRKAFDSGLAKDRFYLSLQDFYAARVARAKKEGDAGSASSSAKSSPYHAYINYGNSGLATFENVSTERHAFIADGFSKAEPSIKEACNIFLNQPFDYAFLTTQRPADKNTPPFEFSASVNNDSWSWRDAFTRVAGDNTLTVSENVWAAILKDYLDEDGVVTDMATPSVELAPMISQIAFPDNVLAAEFDLRQEGKEDPSTSQMVLGRRCTFRMLNKEQFDTGVIPITVEVVWPFKYFAKRLATRVPAPNFKIEGSWVISLEKTGGVINSEYRAQRDSIKMYEWEADPVSITFSEADEDAIQSNQENCYKKIALMFNKPDGFADSENEMELLDFTVSPGTGVPSYVYPQGGSATDSSQWEDYRVVSTVWLRIYDGDNRENRPVDQVPCFIDLGQFSYAAAKEMWKQVTPQLYFKTQKLVDIFGTSANMTTLQIKSTPLSYAGYPEGWNSLEIPDPRFNYKAANWIARNLVMDPSFNNNFSIEVDGKMNQSTKDMLGQDGRDKDIFMSVSDAGYMQSPGELGFIIRPFNYTPAGQVDFENQKTVDQLINNQESEAKYAMFRTFRLYDHGDGGPEYEKFRRRDFIYNNFYVATADGYSPSARVNPLSDLKSVSSGLPTVLEAAILDTPLNYFFAATNCPAVWTTSEEDKATLDRRLFGSYTGDSKWKNFVQAWGESMDEVVHYKPVPGKFQRKTSASPVDYTFRVNQDWRSNLSDVYGDWDGIRWYDDTATVGANEIPEQRKIFENHSLSTPLHEIDRKMLYAFSLDSFSDRQQLFLYFIRAETSMPSLGSGADSGARSLAGGRAVALVWRDPYPRGYDRDLAQGASVDQSNADSPWDKKMSNDVAWYPEINDYISPWTQYYGGDKNSDPRRNNGYRWNGWHDARVLFFKQLD